MSLSDSIVRFAPRIVSLVALAALGALTAGCSADSGDEANDDADVVSDDAALSGGANGGACLESPYNCKLRVNGGNRVADATGSIDWETKGGTVRDGMGNPIAEEKSGAHLKFNFGQARVLGGKLHILAMTTAARSAGWFPLDGVVKKSELQKAIGRVNGDDPQMGKMACYEISNVEPNAALAAKKVVFDATDTHERAGDYLPLTRANGKRYANLAYNVPGLALGGPSIDILAAGTKFQRVGVPTSATGPHLGVKLYVQNSDGHYTKRDGTLFFYYGYVVAADGAKHFGWVARDALQVSSGCK